MMYEEFESDFPPNFSKAKLLLRHLSGNSKVETRLLTRQLLTLQTRFRPDCRRSGSRQSERNGICLREKLAIEGSVLGGGESEMRAVLYLKTANYES